MATPRSFVIALLLATLLVTSCGSPPATSTTSSPSTPASSPSGAATQVGSADTAPVESQPATSTPVETAPAEPAPTPEPSPSASGLTTITLTPVGDFSDEDLVKAMTIIKLEMSARPELEVKTVSRLGSGNDQTISIETGLSTSKPVVAAINGILNRERFEGRLGDKILFDNNDLRFICRLPVCAGVEDMSVCPSTSSGAVCTWAFGVVLTDTSATTVSENMRGLPTRQEGDEEIIAQPINLYLNGQLLDYVYVPANQTSEPITDFTITGNASGPTPKEAQKSAVAAMDRVRDKMAKRIIPVNLKVNG